MHGALAAPVVHGAVEQLGGAVQPRRDTAAPAASNRYSGHCSRGGRWSRANVSTCAVVMRARVRPDDRCSSSRADDQLLHFGRAFVDAQRADLAVQPLDRRSPTHAQRRRTSAPRASMTRCADSVAVILAIAASRVVRRAADVAQPRGAVGQQRGGVDRRSPCRRARPASAGGRPASAPNMRRVRGARQAPRRARAARSPAPRRRPRRGRCRACASRA